MVGTKSSAAEVPWEDSRWSEAATGAEGSLSLSRGGATRRNERKWDIYFSERGSPTTVIKQNQTQNNRGKRTARAMPSGLSFSFWSIFCKFPHSSSSVPSNVGKII